MKVEGDGGCFVPETARHDFQKKMWYGLFYLTLVLHGLKTQSLYFWTQIKMDTLRYSAFPATAT